MPRTPPLFAPQPQRQQGVALFVVLVFVMLSMLLALWASRTSLFNEMVVGNDADYQRAFEAAQALLQDAELDIRAADYDTATSKTMDNLDCSAGGDICRSFAADRFPLEAKEITAVINTLDAQPTKCRSGLCARRTGRQDFWNYTNATSPAPSNPQPGEVPLEELTKAGIGARFGQYTGAKLGDTSNPANPILADRSADDKGGWYWIEIMPYSDAAKTKNLVVDAASNQLKLNLDVYVVYRITALAFGRKPGTQVVLQETYARQRKKD
jgi:type IV pilus assembly protein PilX